MIAQLLLFVPPLAFCTLYIGHSFRKKRIRQAVAMLILTLILAAAAAAAAVCETT